MDWLDFFLSFRINLPKRMVREGKNEPSRSTKTIEVHDDGSWVAVLYEVGVPRCSVYVGSISAKLAKGRA